MHWFDAYQPFSQTWFDVDWMMHDLYVANRTTRILMENNRSLQHAAVWLLVLGLVLGWLAAEIIHRMKGKP